MAVALPLVIASCGSDDDEEETMPLTEELTGLGDNAGSPTGTVYKLPTGIELTGQVLGSFNISYGTRAEQEIAARYDNLLPKQRTQQSGVQTRAEYTTVSTVVGSGGLVSICLILKNTTSSSITVDLPAGMLIESASGEYQNGLLVKKATFVIPANSTTPVGVYMYCCNLGRHASGIDAVYKWPPVITNNVDLNKLIDAVKNKKINYEEFTSANISEYYTNKSPIQSIVWDITDDGTGFTDAHLQQINAIPNSN